MDDIALVPIYVRLMGEGTACCRPTRGERIGKDIFKVLATPDYNAEDEHWEFPPGSIVRAATVAGKNYLLAVKP